METTSYPNNSLVTILYDTFYHDTHLAAGFQNDKSIINNYIVCITLVTISSCLLKKYYLNLKLF